MLQDYTLSSTILLYAAVMVAVQEVLLDRTFNIGHADRLNENGVTARRPQAVDTGPHFSKCHTQVLHLLGLSINEQLNSRYTLCWVTEDNYALSSTRCDCKRNTLGSPDSIPWGSRSLSTALRSPPKGLIEERFWQVMDEGFR